jgi:pyrophosphatase PpaX
MGEAGDDGMIRCVLFDLDGTLVDTWALYVECYVRILEPHLGRRLTLGELRALQPASELRFLSRHLGVADLARAHRAFVEHYGDLHATHFAGVYPGIPALLERLRGRQLRIGIITGKSRAAWEITDREAGLGPFDVVVTDDDVREPKPDPQGLCLALRRLALSPAEAIYVGDSVQDAGAARGAHMRFAAALWPKADHEADEFLSRIRAIGVYGELKQPEDLPALLDSEGSPPR